MVETKANKSRSNTNEKLLSNEELPSFISMSFSQRLGEEDRDRSTIKRSDTSQKEMTNEDDAEDNVNHINEELQN